MDLTLRLLEADIWLVFSSTSGSMMIIVPSGLQNLWHCEFLTYSWKQRLRRDNRNSSHRLLPTEMSAPWLLCILSQAGAHQIWGCRARGDCCWALGCCWSSHCCHSYSCFSSSLLTQSLSPWWDSLQAERKQTKLLSHFSVSFLKKKSVISHAFTDNTGNGLVLEQSLN